MTDTSLPAPIDSPADSAPDQSADQAGVGIARATSLLALGTMASRILGFGQELLMAHYFQRGLVDAFQIAITVPRDLYDLAISGHVNSAVVPVLSEYAAKDKDELWRLVGLLSGAVLIILGGVVLLLELFAAPIVGIYRGNISEEAITLTINLLRITAPALLFLGLYAVFSGTLYALKRFTAPAFGAAVFNGTLVIFLVLLAPVIGIERAAIGWLIGSAAQCGLQALALWRSRVPVRPRLKGMLSSPGVRRIGLLYVPVMVSLVVDVLINRTFSYNLASRAGEGSIAYMNWATSLREFPMGLVGTAISIAVLPTLARQALDPGQRAAFRDTLGQGIRLALSLIVPATVGLFVLAGPLIGLLFEHGQFTATDTNITALVLRLYLIGIPFAAVDLLLVFAFYAQKDTMTPAVIGVFSLICYMGIALMLQGQYSFYSLMIADSMKFLIHTGLSLILLRVKLGGFGAQRLLITTAKVCIAAGVTGLTAYLATRLIAEVRSPQGVFDRALMVFIPSGIGVLVYWIGVYVLRIREFSWFLLLVRQTVGRRRK
jgi:putative peptidoglycan lipid II flippase